ncbi:MAG: hypothetical protein GY795_33420 [Desulfobacterales bacterium]|nr:hypothetical protein [Desulfobacterales bacterium]
MFDKINIILTYGADYEDKDLSWRAFLSFKGINKKNENAAKIIKKNDDPFRILVTLRREYYQSGIVLFHTGSNVCLLVAYDNEKIKFFFKNQKLRFTKLISSSSILPAVQALNPEFELVWSHPEHPSISTAFSDACDPFNILKR